MKPIRIRVVIDQDYLNCYWAFSRNDIRKAVRRAMVKFSSAFPEVSFILRHFTFIWDSGLPKLRDFPVPYLLEMPRTTFKKSLISLLDKLEQIRIGGWWFKFFNTIDYKKLDKTMAKKSKISRFWMLMGKFHRLMMSAVLYQARTDYQVQNPPEIFIVFTEKLFVLDSGGCAGVSMFEGNHMIIGLNFQSDLSHIILHELGHLFGAEHPKDKKTKSVMLTGNDRYSRFDKKNSELIRKCLRRRAFS